MSSNDETTIDIVDTKKTSKKTADATNTTDPIMPPKTSDVDEEPASEGQYDLKKMTIPAIKKFCKDYKISHIISGKTKKDDMIASILEHASTRKVISEAIIMDASVAPAPGVAPVVVDAAAEIHTHDELKKMAVAALKQYCKTKNIPMVGTKKDDIIAAILSFSQTEPVVDSEVGKNASNPAPVDAKNYAKMSVANLKELCKQRNIKLSAKVKKDEIVSLLEKNDTEENVVLEKSIVDSDAEQQSDAQSVQDVSKKVDYSKMTVANLKDLCKSRNIKLSAKSKKDEIVALLEKDDTEKSVIENAIIERKHTPILHDDSDDEHTNSQPVQHVAEKVDYSKMSVANLKDLCKSRNIKLSAKSKKDDIVAVLEKDDAEKVGNPEHVSEPEPVSEPDIQSTQVDYSKMTVANLKDLCKSRNIKFSSKSKKDDIIGLLQLADDNMRCDCNRCGTPRSDHSNSDTEDNATEKPKTTEKKEKKSKKTSKKEDNVLVESDVDMDNIPPPPKLVRQNAVHGTCKTDDTQLDDENVEYEEEIVQTHTVLLVHAGIKYWMDTEDANGIHDIYDYTSLDHIGFFNKNSNTMTKIDE